MIGNELEQQLLMIEPRSLQKRSQILYLCYILSGIDNILVDYAEEITSST